MKKQKLTGLLFLALFVTAVQSGAVTPTQAQEKHEGHDHGAKSESDEHDHSKEGAAIHAEHHPKATHGGVVLEIDEYHGELVLDEQRIKLYLSDHDGKEIDAKGFSAVAMILSAQGRQGPIKLNSADGSHLISPDPVSKIDGTRVVITLTDPRGHSSQVRYQMP